MKKQFLFLVTLSLFFCHFVKAQEADKTANEIIKQSKSSVLKKNLVINSFYLEYDGDYRSNAERKSKSYLGFTYKTKLWFEDSLKIKQKVLATYPNSQQELIERIFSKEDFSETNKVKIDEKGFTEMTFIPNGDVRKIKEEKISKLKFTAFSSIFPLLLKFDNSLKFKFVGVAKAGKQKADVIETKLSDSYKLNLFFDRETHLLLLMTAKFYDEILKKEIEQKFFYSDFKEESGLLFAHKIIIQENNEAIEEKLIKLITPNPEMKTDFFEVKK